MQILGRWILASTLTLGFAGGAAAQVCPDSLVSNGDFTAGIVTGSMPLASVTDWSLITESPQVVTDGCDDPGALQMWGNQVVGESVQQHLPGVGIQAGKCYELHICYRWLNNNPTLPQYVRFRVTASSSAPTAYPPLTSNMVIGITPNTSSETWKTLTFPAWKAPANASWITINPENDQVVNNGNFVSWGQVDDICLREAPTWSPTRLGVAGVAWDQAVYDAGLGAGPELCVGGTFPTAGGLSANGIAKWNGTNWATLGTGVSFQGTVYALTVFDDPLPGGPALYAGGFFTTMNSVPANDIAKWDGSSWSALGTGIVPGAAVRSLVSGNIGGGGSALYVGGGFATAGGTAASNVARWNGTTWSALGSGVDAFVTDMVVHDDGLGGGPALYVAGAFSHAGGSPANGVAKWNGSVWSNLGSGPSGGINALAVYDDGLGGGKQLYAGGSFTSISSVPANFIARWNGTSWSALGTGLNSSVQTLGVATVDGIKQLYAGGSFNVAGSVSASRVAAWNGTTWSALDSGIPGGPPNTPYSMCEYDDGTGPALFVGGEFLVAGGYPSRSFAKWGCSRFAVVGSGLASGFGLPHLSGAGQLATGKTIALTMEQGRPSSTCWLITGLGQLNAPFKGGVMVPTVNLLTILGTDPAGALDIAFPTPALPPGVFFAFQEWIQDATGPVGYAASNGLVTITQ